MENRKKRYGRFAARGAAALFMAATLAAAPMTVLAHGGHGYGDGYRGHNRTRDCGFYRYDAAADARSDNEAQAARFAEEVLALVNEERARSGARPLALASDLMDAAAVRADEITRVFSHTRPDGRPFSSLLPRTGGLGENIAAGLSTPEDVVRQWMDSPGHRANILNPSYRELGVGYVCRPGSEYTHYWVQIFRMSDR